ncbi:MAG: homoserine dehydrogenase [Actinomycetota bacterium]|nr:homoserine dehydrogenase [Actinomycetota bacterium]
MTTGRNAVRVGLLGCGIVGGATARVLTEQAATLSERAGVRIDLAKVAVRDLSKPRTVQLPDEVWTADAWSVVKDPTIDVIVETIGGVEPARDLIIEAARSGKHIVTANKELLSTLGEKVMGAAEQAGVDLLFEGSVAGGIPIIRPMKESLAGDRVTRVMGIVNGTTNFILTRMSETGETFEAALGEAERLGYPELDPSADIEGHDAAAKLAILASLAFNARVVASDVEREGISKVTPEDVAAAHELGYEIKLLAVAEESEGQVSARVNPAMLPRLHPLAAVRDVFNAVFVVGAEAGELMFLGRGAGGGPTASAVVGDIVEIARNVATGGRATGCTCYRDKAQMRPPHEANVRYYVVLSVLDQPGVLAAVAGVFAAHEISIASVRQEGIGEEATLALITHVGTEGRHDETFAELETLDSVRSIDSRLRVVGTAEA